MPTVPGGVHITVRVHHDFYLVSWRCPAEVFTQMKDDLRYRFAYGAELRWVPAERHWWVAAYGGTRLEAWCDHWANPRTGDTIVWEDMEEAAPPPPRQPPPACSYSPAEDLRTLCLLPTAPSALWRGVYRTLSRLNHPDVAGKSAREQAAAEERQKALNLAFDRLTAYLEKGGAGAPQR